MNKDFLWGAALSNVQAEGGYLEDGKGLNVYDTLEISFETGQNTLWQQIIIIVIKKILHI